MTNNNPVSPHSNRDQLGNNWTLNHGGMTVEKANPTMKGELQEIGATMTAEWLEAAGAEGKTNLYAQEKA